jgi:membrane-associated protein
VSAITTELGRLSGLLVYALVAALVFGETALFFGFVLPGEIAVVLGGVLASRGRVSLPLLMLVVVAAAIVGPLIGYEVGRRMGSRVVASRFLRRVSGPVERAASTLNARGAAAVLVGRFTAVLRALMPALAGTARMPYRTFAVYNAVSGIVWGVGYCLLGYLAGSAYTVVEREVGTGFAARSPPPGRDSGACPRRAARPTPHVGADRPDQDTNSHLTGSPQVQAPAPLASSGVRHTAFLPGSRMPCSRRAAPPDDQ